MAKSKGIIKIIGTLGDLTFYEKDGKTFVKRKSSVSKSKILNSPEYQRTRENMQEFAGSATIGKELRRNLIQLKYMADNGMHNRLSAAIRKMINLGSGNRGERVFEVLAQKAELIGFEFHDTDLFASSLYAPFTVTANVDRNQATLNLPVFNAADFVSSPPGATHFKIILNVCTLTDYTYNTTTSKYQSTNPNLAELTDTVKSGFMPVIGNTTAINLVANIPTAPVLAATEGLVASVGIEYYQELNGNFYLFAQGNAMRIQNIF
ncbi:MAG: hypothetical protein ACWA42_02285 [Lutibacter sp.]